MRLEFVTVDVFTDRPFGGNQLAVIPQAESLSIEQMQAIAGEFNLSETTFVLPAQDPAHTAEVRIFTTKFEMPFAGHPNVGTAFVVGRLRSLRRQLVFEEKAGLVPIDLLRICQEITESTFERVRYGFTTVCSYHMLWCDRC